MGQSCKSHEFLGFMKTVVRNVPEHKDLHIILDNLSAHGVDYIPAGIDVWSRRGQYPRTYHTAAGGTTPTWASTPTAAMSRSTWGPSTAALVGSLLACPEVANATLAQQPRKVSRPHSCA